LDCFQTIPQKVVVQENTLAVLPARDCLMQNARATSQGPVIWVGWEAVCQ